MTSVPAPATATPTVSPALSAFLRGIERRAFVFAQVQCGDDQVALLALGRAMRAFRSTSAVSPLSAWPAGFWALLLAQAELSQGESEVPELTALGSGPRASLLLRMVGGLDFPHAAQVLGVSESTYRFALQRALQQLGEAGISYAVLGALRERLHHQVKTLPDERTAALAALRARVLQGETDPDDVPPLAAAPWRRRAPWLLLALLGLAFAATFWPSANPLQPGGTEGLPAESAPAPLPTQSDADRVTHPDYALLAAPDDEALAADLAFLSWVASGQAPPLPAADPAAVPGQTPLPEAAAADVEPDDAP